MQISRAGSSSNSDRATGTGTGTGAHTSASTVGERLTEPVHKGTDSTTAAYTDAGRHETPVEQSAQAFTDEAAPATAAQTKHTPSIGTTAHEHASSPRNASNKPTAFSTGAGTGAGADFGSSTGDATATSTQGMQQQSQLSSCIYPSPALYGEYSLVAVAKHVTSQLQPLVGCKPCPHPSSL